MAGPAVAADLVEEVPVVTGNKSPLESKTQQIPCWLKNYLKDADLSVIENSIFEAEKTTNAEIIPMVVKSSTATGHVAPLLSLVLFCLILLLEITIHWWTPLTLPLCYLIAIWLSRFFWVQRFLTSNRDESQQVARQAEVEFYRRGFHKTQGRTGVLIYLSMMEHKAIVLADEAIAHQFPPETWQQVLDLLLKELKTKNMKQGFVLAIEKCAQVLAEKFPKNAADTNEIHNSLIIKE